MSVPLAASATELASATAARDPATRRRIGIAVAALLVLWPILVGAEFKPWRLFDAASWSVMGNFLGGFLPPSRDAEFLLQLGRATLETLAIATAG
ncbi:MAG: ABC transporter permease, partial [Pseudomonadota bacterium]|nr:ABC transporter permease [Pseudomonadota bacterium]